MEFAGDLGLWQRRVAETPEGTAQYMAAYEALGIESGQTVLDLGCGGGHLVREIARAVGAGGRVVGLDPNSEQLSAARQLCTDLEAAEFREGDATALPFEAGTFDSLASVRMYEYVSDVDRALTESRRVMRRGGKAAILSVLWDHWRFHGAEQNLNARMHEVWRSHCPHQMLPLELPRKLKAAEYRSNRSCC